MINVKRKELRRYGIIFTCHLHVLFTFEITNSVETDSFLLALQTFIGLGKNIQQMRSDNGNNFVSTVKELRKTIREMDHAQIQRYLQILNDLATKSTSYKPHGWCLGEKDQNC